MRLFAASFATEESAVLALEELAGRFGESARMRLAPLGHAGPEGSTARMILAGRFEDDVIAAVRLAVTELGGSMVVDSETTT